MRHENGKQGKRWGSCEHFEVPGCDLSKGDCVAWVAVEMEGWRLRILINFVVTRLQLEVWKVR